MFSEMLPLHDWYLNPTGSFKGADDVIGGPVHFWPRYRVAKEKDGRNTGEAVGYSGGKDKHLELQWTVGTRDQILRRLQVMDYLNQNHNANDLSLSLESKWRYVTVQVKAKSKGTVHINILKSYLLQNVQTGSEGHTVSYSMGSGGPFPEVKPLRRKATITPTRYRG